jgi:26S proteasome regulatory subunit T5
MDLDAAFDADQTSALAELESAPLDDILTRSRMLEHELRVLRDESNRLNLECQSENERVKENKEKIKLNKQLPYLVGHVVELLDLAPEEEELEDAATADVDAQRSGKAVVLKTTTRQTIFLPVVGLVDADALKPGDLVGVNKDSYLILDTLPAEYDSRVKGDGG